MTERPTTFEFGGLVYIVRLNRTVFEYRAQGTRDWKAAVDAIRNDNRPASFRQALQAACLRIANR